MTVEEILNDLGVTVDPAKTANVAKWNTTLAATESGAAQKLADAQKQLKDAQDLQRVIDDNIAKSGLTEMNMAQLQANNAALTAALASRDAAIKSIKDQGFTGITVPDLPPLATAPAKDPVKELTDKLMGGFAAMGQTMNEVNRYQRVFGAPLPEDPATLADRAVAAGFKNVRAYMEQTYKVSEREQATVAAAHKKEVDDAVAAGVEEYKAAHPITTGHPELGPGVPSNFPNIPKPSDAAGVAKLAGMSPMEKIRTARDRVSNEIKTRMAAA
jgi:hypothetical protein